MSHRKVIAAAGGRARAAKLSPEQRSAAARVAAKARWGAKATRCETCGAAVVFSADELESVAGAIEDAVPAEDEAGLRTIAAWKRAVALVRAEVRRMRKAGR